MGADNNIHHPWLQDGDEGGPLLLLWLLTPTPLGPTPPRPLPALLSMGAVHSRHGPCDARDAQWLQGKVYCLFGNKAPEIWGLQQTDKTRAEDQPV